VSSLATAAAPSPQEIPRQADFVRALTLTDATMLVAGSMVGSGIFIVSADIARTVVSPGWLLMAWVVTGVITMLGALAYGELAGMFPRAGGQYVYLRESLGPLIGFLYGWTLFTVIQTGTIAAVAVAFGRFFGVLVPSITPDRFAWFPQFDLHTPGGVIQLGLSPQRVVALISLWFTTWINLRGVREGKIVQTTLTTIKVSALIGLILLGLTVGRNATAIVANFRDGHFTAGPSWTAAFSVVFASALVGSLFSSDAWNNVTFAAAEVQNPRRNLPLALVMGTGLVFVLYVAANLAYLSVLPISGIAHAPQDRVGTAAVQAILGAGTGVVVMAIAILISTFGCNNGLILSGARVYYAMARDRLFFKRAGTLNANAVPATALIVQAIWTTLLCLTGTYSQLLDYVIFAALLFYALTTIGLFVLRVRQPDVERPYRAIGYPVLPALYIGLASAVAVALLVADKTRAQALIGLVLVLLGVPIYFIWRAVESPAPLK
jgi:basic amino acid/polyamine antiporter, APA family